MKFADIHENTTENKFIDFDLAGSILLYSVTAAFPGNGSLLLLADVWHIAGFQEIPHIQGHTWQSVDGSRRFRLVPADVQGSGIPLGHPQHGRHQFGQAGSRHVLLHFVRTAPE